MRVFSGIQATGAKHIGNYIGAMRQYVSTQEEGDAFFCIVDLHSITTDYDPTGPARAHARPGGAALSRSGSTPSSARSSCRATSPRTPRRRGCSRPSPGSGNSAA